MAERLRLRGVAAAVSAVCLLLGSGCSSEAPPSESAPGLATRLDRVDDAVAAGDYAAARAALNALAAATAQVQVGGRITEEQASIILERISEMLAALDSLPDTPAPTDEPEPEPSEESEPVEPEPEPEPDDEDEDNGNGNGKDKDKGKGKGKGD